GRYADRRPASGTPTAGCRGRRAPRGPLGRTGRHSRTASRGWAIRIIARAWPVPPAHHVPLTEDLQNAVAARTSTEAGCLQFPKAGARRVRRPFLWLAAGRAHGLAHPGDDRGVVRVAEDRRAGDEGIRARGGDLADVVGLD